MMAAALATARALFRQIILLAFGAVVAFSQSLVIEKLQPRNGEEGAAFVNGYLKTDSGTVLAYHSSHPDARNALFVRANNEAPRIQWESDTLREPQADGFYHLLWIAGFERQGFKNDPKSYNFDLFVNGVRRFVMKNRKDSTAQDWLMRDSAGELLHFSGSYADHVGDLFGDMELKIPSALVKKNRPIVFAVAGEDSGSEDWYMTMQYSFGFTPRILAEPGVLRGDPPTQPVRLSMDNLTPSARIRYPRFGGGTVETTLAVGANIFYVPVQAVKERTRITVILMTNGVETHRDSVPVDPVIHRDVYILPYAHNDIGYTDLQPVVEKKHWANIDNSLRLIEETKDFPPDARFKWNVEVLWAFDTYMRTASDEKKNEVLDAVRNGSIGLQAFYGNTQTGIANAPEMSHTLEFARTFSRQYQLPVDIALMSDVPGFTWGTVSTLAQSGIKYFASAPNPFDRRGNLIETWGDKPFYWKSQSGEDSVLFWIAGASYATFHEGSLPKLGPDKLFDVMRRFDDEKYPYRIAYLPYTLGDNAGVDTLLPEFVKEWNEKYSSPHLIISTHKQMFDDFSRAYGDSLPSFGGDLTGYWEDGTISAARETALNRSSADTLLEAEALFAMKNPAAYPARDFSEAWRQAILYDEHTWGAWNSISEPDDPDVRRQWEIKQKMATDADSASNSLLERALGRPKDVPSGATFDVYNTLSWPRTDLIELPPHRWTKNEIVTDDRGKRLRCQKLLSGELAVLVENVPPFSAERISVKPGNQRRRHGAWVGHAGLSTRTMTLRFGPLTGTITRFYSNTLGRELIDSTASTGANALTYILGTDTSDTSFLHNVNMRSVDNGDLVASLLIQGDLAGADEYACLVRVVDGLDRVDITHWITKTAQRKKEGLHLLFPFEVPNGTRRYDVANSIVRVDSDQLAGVCKNFFSIQSWMDVSNPTFGVTVATLDAPIAEFGEITAEQPWRKNAAEGSTLISYLLNNYWHTNFRADQAGDLTFRYSIYPHLKFDPVVAAKEGKERREPLIVAPAPGGLQALTSVCKLSNDRIICQSIKPTGNGKDCLLFLYNPSNQAQSCSIQWKKEKPAPRVFVSNAFGDSLASAPASIVFAPSSTKYILVAR